jgi:hypothetical protein
LIVDGLFLIHYVSIDWEYNEMKKTGVTLLSLLLGSLSFNALAEEPMAEFVQETLTLTIPTIKIGDETLYNGTLKLNDSGSFDIVGFSRVAPTPELVGQGVECTSSMVTEAKFEKITSQMMLADVNAIIGCEGKFLAVSVAGEAYTWKEGGLLPRINVTFPNETSVKKAFTR